MRFRGGNSAVHKETKQTVLVDDQTVHSKSCAALINSYKAKQPIVLIAGNSYQLFPYDLEQRSYVILGYYLITQAWGTSQTNLNISPVTFKRTEEPEPSPSTPRGYFIRWKFLFQWIEAQGEPWWIEARDPEAVLPIPFVSESYFLLFSPI